MGQSIAKKPMPTFGLRMDVCPFMAPNNGIEPHLRRVHPGQLTKIVDMNSHILMQELTLLTYRLASYTTTAWMDDPAMLALLFC